MQQLMALGLFVFSLPTLAHQELSRKRDWRFARAARIGARDDAQFTGPGEDSIQLSGSSYAELSDGTASLEALAAMAATGRAWPLVDGTGRVFGAYVIETVDEKHRELLADGTPLRIDFDLSLGRVDEEGERA